MNNETKEKLLREYSIKICEVFNDILADNNIYIPDECRERNEEEANLYGESYYQCEDTVKNILTDLINKIEHNKTLIKTVAVDFKESCDDDTIIIGNNLNFEENDNVVIFRIPSMDKVPFLNLKVKLDYNIDENLVYISKNNYFNKMYLDFNGDVISIMKKYERKFK